MLPRLPFREETYNGPRQGLRSSRYIRTVKLLNDGRGVYPTIRTRLLEDELRFQACQSIRTRPRVTHDWNGTLRTGNPVRTDLVTQYMTFVREDQTKAAVEVSQAPPLLHSHLEAIIAHMTLRIRCTQDPYDGIVLGRDIALFTITFSTIKRGDGLRRTLIQRILRLPN